MRLAISCFLVLLGTVLPASSASAADLRIALQTDDGVQYGTPHEVSGTLREGEAELGGGGAGGEGQQHQKTGNGEAHAAPG